LIESLQQKIEELYLNLKEITQQKREAEIDARKFREEKKSIDEKIRRLREEADELKKQRDNLNFKVQELKTLREKAKNERKEKISMILQLKETLRLLETKKPEKSRQALENEIQKLDWKLQTTPMTAQEERPIIERLKQLEAQLHVYKQLASIKETIKELRRGVNELTIKANQYHGELYANASQSQHLHRRRLEIIMKMKELKTQANIMHHKFIQAKQKAAVLSEHCSQIMVQIDALKREQSRIEEEKRVEKEKETLSEIERKAREKLKRGQKLTWEEFKIIAEKGLP
jgi:uncharacterized coiled-coil DUF342 family protein